jgi:hypothetical protein
MSLPDGRQVTGIGTQASAIKDPNGNQIQFQNIDNITTPLEGGPFTGSPGATTAHVMTDDVGRQINVIHVLGSGGGDVQDMIQQTGANNSTLSWTVNWGSTTGQLTYQGCFTQTCLPGSAYAVSSIGGCQRFCLEVQL